MTDNTQSAKYLASHDRDCKAQANARLVRAERARLARRALMLDRAKEWGLCVRDFLACLIFFYGVLSLAILLGSR